MSTASQRRRARRLALSRAWDTRLAEARAGERARAKLTLAEALSRRPYRTPTAAMLGFEPSEAEDGGFGWEEETGDSVTVLGKVPDSLTVAVPVTPPLNACAMGKRDLSEVSHRHLQAIFVARPWRVRVGARCSVHWWNWEPLQGGHYTAAVKAHRHLHGARAAMTEAREAFNSGAPWLAARAVMTAIERLDLAIALTSEWIGADER